MPLARLGSRRGQSPPAADGSFSGERLRLARLFAGMTLEELGARVGATRQWMHQLETAGGRSPAPDMAEALVAALGVSEAFFRAELPAAIAPEHCHFRKQATTPQAVVQQVLARGALLDLVVCRLSDEIDFPAVNFPQHPVAGLRDAEGAAEACRAHWGLGTGGPIRSMTRVAENAGAIVAHFPGVSERVDALSIHRPRPLIIRSSAKESIPRLRFDLAHECGLLVMHQGVETGSKETEAQAHRFASAFLLPARAFAIEFPRRGRYMDWQGLYAMKARWGVSVRAIVRRAFDLLLIDAAQYRAANIHLVRSGQGREEQGDHDWATSERPEALASAFAALDQSSEGELGRFLSRIGLDSHALQRLTGT